MAITFTYRPLATWPGKATPAAERQTAPFKASARQTNELLKFELGKVRATNVVIEVQVAAWQIRADGSLRSDATPSGPAVILSFSGRDGQYSFPCDTFKQWWDNLRAIALALEALRKIDRYGVTRQGQQYQGFRALPPPAFEKPKLSPAKAAEFIASKVEGVSAEFLMRDQKLFDVIFKLASIKLHPDSGGSHEDFVQLQEAGAVLVENFKSSSGTTTRAG